jgi:hypothetical protein
MRNILPAVVISAVALAAVVVVLPRLRAFEPAHETQPAQAAATSPLTQRDAGEGAVEIEVTLVIPGSREAAKYGADTQTVFPVSMNTHSIDLSSYDLTTVSELLVAGRMYTPTRWVSTSDNSHHRSGALIFPKVDLRVALELRIKTIARIPVRTFRWAP